MQTLIVDREDWEDLVDAATHALACLRVLETLREKQYLALQPAADADPAEVERFVREFDVMIESNRERLEEALLPYEDEAGDDTDDA